jgi:predicted transcriptional regulator
MTNGPIKTLSLAERRKQVAQLYLRKQRQEDIAGVMGVSQSTVSRDITYLRKEWEADAQEKIETVKGQELAELRDMERDCALQFSQTKDVRWLRERRQIKERIAKLLGLDAPQRQELTGADGGPVQQVVEYVNDWRNPHQD